MFYCFSVCRAMKPNCFEPPDRDVRGDQKFLYVQKNDYFDLRPLMTLTSITTMAITSRICINPPSTWPLNNAISHKTIRITKRVQSIFGSFQATMSPNVYE
jgi:hypothetical protein